MAQITATIPDALNGLLLQAVCAEYGYRPDLLNASGSPVGSGEFVQGVFVNFGKEVVRAYQMKQAAAAAAAQASQAVADTFNTNTISIQVT